MWRNHARMLVAATALGEDPTVELTMDLFRELMRQMLDDTERDVRVGHVRPQ